MFVAARGSALPLVIPVIIMGGILSGWFTPTEAGMIAAVYILVVLIPALNRGHVWELPRDFMYAGLLYSLPLAAVAGASAFGWMVAYLRGPDIVAGHITAFAGTDGAMIMFLLVVLFVIVGDFIDAVPAIIIFMPIINKLTEVGNIKPLHMGVVIITTLVFGLITPPYGLSLLVASKYVGVGFGQAVVRSLPLYVVFLLTIAFVVAFPDIVLWLPKQFLPESVGCFKAPGGTASSARPEPSEEPPCIRPPPARRCVRRCTFRRPPADAGARRRDLRPRPGAGRFARRLSAPSTTRSCATRCSSSRRTSCRRAPRSPSRASSARCRCT